MKSALLVVLGAFFGLLGVAVIWLWSAECPPNVLVITGSLPMEQTAEVYIQDKLIWSGSTWVGTKIHFDMDPGEGHFHVKTGEKEFRLGYVERADGRDHVLAIGKAEAAYMSIDQGILEHGRRILACR